MDDPETDEEPGKILHEYRPVAEPRFAEAGWPVRDGALLYYGTADATSWFLVVLAALGDAALTRELEPAWRAAGGWLARRARRAAAASSATARASARAGWRSRAGATRSPRSSTTRRAPGIVRPDGSDPAPPLADADSQAVAFAALDALARARSRRRLGAARGGAARRVLGALGLRGRWRWRATARRCPGAGSQLGWLLWAGALDRTPRRPPPSGSCAPDVLTPFGLRTLSSGHPAFGPQAYHRGGVWPFDCWLGWGGLRAAGRDEEAERVRAGVLAALDRLGLAPELYAVDAAGELEPVPVANRVQAWTVGARWALENDWDGRPAARRAPPAPRGPEISSTTSTSPSMRASTSATCPPAPGARRAGHARAGDPQAAHLHADSQRGSEGRRTRSGRSRASGTSPRPPAVR